MIIDTHSHLQFAAFSGDRDAVIKCTAAQQITIINVGTSYVTSRDAVLLAGNYPHLFAAIGLHPMYASAEFIKIKYDPNEGEFLSETSFDKEKYKKLALSDSRRVVAIGEIGLDYYYKPKSAAKLQQFKEKQKQVFLDQLDLAKELQLPVILHCRMAHDDVIEILQSQHGLRGVIHCFTGTLEQAKKYIELGFHIGINGIIFKFNIDAVIENIPLDNILVETDCPYLTPPMADQKRNEPMFIQHIIKKIAQLKNVSFEKVCEQTTANAKVLFKI